jgi:hypothetical protein
MNESILLEALKEIKDISKGVSNTVAVSINTIAFEAIKKWEDSSPHKEKNIRQFLRDKNIIRTENQQALYELIRDWELSKK